MPAVGTVVYTLSDQQSRSRPVKKFVAAWTCSAAGEVSGAQSVTRIAGEITEVIFIPDAVDAPSANYDVTLIDENNVDVLKGLGANRHTANIETVLPRNYANDGVVSPDQNFTNSPVIRDDKVTLVVANAGATKKGKVVVYFR